MAAGYSFHGVRVVLPCCEGRLTALRQVLVAVLPQQQACAVACSALPLPVRCCWCVAPPPLEVIKQGLLVCALG